jgi:hypothetical protein
MEKGAGSSFGLRSLVSEWDDSIRKAMLFRPSASGRESNRTPPIFSTARCERTFSGPPRNTTVRTNRREAFGDEGQ